VLYGYVLKLARKNMLRHRLRSGLTLAGIAIAIVSFGLLRTVVDSWYAGAELGAAVAIQVGHTGPLMPSECGWPIYLDEVALAFPELVILGCHLGQPWHEEMMILAWKHPNVYVETSARPAKFWPPEFMEFVKGWGQDKVIWATDYPLVSFKRAREDEREAERKRVDDLEEEVDELRSWIKKQGLVPPERKRAKKAQ